MSTSLPVINLAVAKFECTFGRGCDGICCRNGRPPIYPEEVELLGKHLEEILAKMRPEAAVLVKNHGFLSRRRRLGLPMLRVHGGWCIFFNEGCVLHRIGAREGDAFRYMPAACALFPLARDAHDSWYVRQKGLNREKWDLFCLDPQNTRLAAAESLAAEIKLAMHFDSLAAGDSVG